MTTYEGTYLGIVVQNNDPEFRGRVKVWVPHINSSVYPQWASSDVDRNFKFPGANINSDLQLVLEKVKADLPWAEYCGSISGENSAGYYNAFDQNATVSDAAYPYSLSGSNYSNNYTQFNLNEEKMGEVPGSVYEKYGSRLTDAFTNTSLNNTNHINPTGTNYRPTTYTNAAKGIFAIPNVGAHVWVLFRAGLPFYPVYIGSVYSQDDFASIFQTEDSLYQDYPQSFENTSSHTTQQNLNQPYRNKMVINQRGGCIEIINTTDRETFKITGFSGSFFEFNNKANIWFAPKNFQSLTQRDKFETVNGHNSLYVGRDFDNIVNGDYYLKTGSLAISAMNAWVAAYSNIASILALPEGNSNKNTLATVILQQATVLAQAEASLGFGGNYISTITKHKFENVGLIFNPFASTRYDLTPKTVTQYINVNGLVTTAIPLIEYTHIDDMPGGNYSLTVGNRYNLLVGAGGIDAKTTGPVNLGGTIIAVGGKQVNIASSDDFNIDGGTNLSVIANMIAIRSRHRNQVVIDDNLGISQNVVIGGGAYVNGEMYLQHITAPYEFQATEQSTINATSGNWAIATATGMITINPPAGSGNVQQNTPYPVSITLNTGTLSILQPHNHVFKNLPLTLLQTPAAVLQAASTVNGGTSAIPAGAVQQTYTLPHYYAPQESAYTTPNGPGNNVQ